jgi:anti-sigma B factor antagonist
MIEKQDGVCLVSFSQDKLNTEEQMVQLKETLRPLVPAERAVVLDLDGIRFLGSNCLGTMISFAWAVRERGGDVKFCGVHPWIMEVFKVLLIVDYFQVLEDRHEALVTSWSVPSAALVEATRDIAKILRVAQGVHWWDTVTTDEIHRRTPPDFELDC